MKMFKLVGGVLSLMVAVSVQADELIPRDVSKVLDQASKILGGGASRSSRSTAVYLEPGTVVEVPAMGRASLYGNDCARTRTGSDGCSYIKVDNSERRVTVVAAGSASALEERWKFKQISPNRIMAIRPDGGVVYIVR
ncbi:hypothetical protein [Stutzerimonas kunmingensis]|uniref:hypothetical protein n=1 Tax=Stutzerimonas kunmingensis TaxID=1211807 RepID=UPI0028A79E2C|nr:hypothetical protein [Stutzerimonas kunmingensis]